MLSAPDAVVRDRLIWRRVDPASGDIYHLRTSPPPQEIAARVVQRAKDKVNIVDAILNDYALKVDNVLAAYAPELPKHKAPG